MSELEQPLSKEEENVNRVTSIIVEIKGLAFTGLLSRSAYDPLITELNRLKQAGVKYSAQQKDYIDTCWREAREIARQKGLGQPEERA